MKKTIISIIFSCIAASLIICLSFAGLIMLDKSVYDETCNEIPNETEITLMLEDYLIINNLELKEVEKARKGKVIVLAYTTSGVYHGTYYRVMLRVEKYGIGNYEWVVERVI